jgi:hypothetical protein
MESTINDVRLANEFKGITFSNFKNTDVKNELLKNLLEGKIESSCYWSAEMICSGHYSDLWDVIIMFYSKYIHLGNPKIAIYLDMRIETFKDILKNGYATNELHLRNNNKIRRLYSEVICVLCLAKQRHGYSLVKIKDDDYDMTKMKDKMKATALSYGENTFQDEDPKELFISINELAYNVSKEGQNVINCCYWMEWVFEFEKRTKRKKEKIECGRRGKMKVDSVYQKEVIWMIWDLFIFESQNRSKIIQKIIKSLLSIFCLKYSPTVVNKRKYILYFVITLLCENPKITEEIIIKDNRVVIDAVTNKIDQIYKQIKKGEKSPGTDYLFKDSKTINLQNTISKMDYLNTFETTQIPRIKEVNS